MIPISEIQRLIEECERRAASLSKVMATTQDVDQYHRVDGKHEAYMGFIRELKELMPSEQVPSQESNRHRGRHTV